MFGCVLGGGGCPAVVNRAGILVFPRGTGRFPGRRERASSVVFRAGGTDPYECMGLDRAGDLTEAEVKAAYRQRVKLVHPDLAGPGEDPSEVARREALTLALNEAYVSVLRDLQMPPGKRESVVLDVFDRCVGDWVGFVNPLEVDGVPHVYWLKLQEIFADECDSDPLLFEERMQQEGVRVNGETVVRWVTLEQQQELMRVVRALETEGDAVRVEAEAWWISDCLRRARKANLM
jgi:hypothetical protein